MGKQDRGLGVLRAVPLANPILLPPKSARTARKAKW
jgi:hypothetical protein